jgi:hypothetical protein
LQFLLQVASSETSGYILILRVKMSGCVHFLLHQFTNVYRNGTVKTVTNHEERSPAYKILVGKPKGKRPLGRPRCRWEDNIKIGLRDMGW